MRTPDSETQVGAVARRVGANVKRLRVARGWSFEKLATEAGLSRSLIWKIEQGAPRAPVAQLQPIAVALGVTLDDLVGAPVAGPKASKRRKAKPLRPAPRRSAGRTVRHENSLADPKS
jgi:transcriptional regulator with XRE-family HTH domain